MPSSQRQFCQSHCDCNLEYSAQENSMCTNIVRRALDSLNFTMHGIYNLQSPKWGPQVEWPFSVLKSINTQAQGRHDIHMYCSAANCKVKGGDLDFVARGDCQMGK